MNDYLLSVLLGIVEGLTEFLPVSSTAHLRLTEALCHVDLESGYWKMYSVVIQLGAILCLPIYFRARIMKFLKTFPAGERGDRTIMTHPLTLTMVAFVVTAIPAFLLKKVVGENLENLHVIGGALLIGGVVMWVVDTLYPQLYPQKLDQRFGGEGGLALKGTPVSGVAAALNPAALVLDYADDKRPPVFHRTDHMEDMNIFQAIWIGLWQILSAVFPGTSRSMSTIAAGQLSGMTRASALEFSFFLSIPTMCVATCWEFLSAVGLRKSSHDTGLGDHPIVMNGERWIVLLIGFVISFFVAWAVVAWFMAFVRRRGFTPFAMYRIVVGILVLIYAGTLQNMTKSEGEPAAMRPAAAHVSPAVAKLMSAPVISG